MMTGRGMIAMTLVWPCSLENIGKGPVDAWAVTGKRDSDMLQGLAELLQNKTAADILHNIQLPKNVTDELRLLPGDGKSHIRERRV